MCAVQGGQMACFCPTSALLNSFPALADGLHQHSTEAFFFRGRPRPSSSSSHYFSFPVLSLCSLHTVWLLFNRRRIKNHKAYVLELETAANRKQLAVSLTRIAVI